MQSRKAHLFSYWSQQIVWKKKLVNSECEGSLANIIYESESCSIVSNSLWPHGLYSPWNSPGQNTGVGSHSLLQGIFPTQGSNPGLPRCKQILYYLSHQGSPRILEWVAYPFFSGSSWPRNRTRVSCIAGKIFTSWATWEAPLNTLQYLIQRLKIQKQIEARRQRTKGKW